MDTPVKRSGGDKLHILVVDDEPSVRRGIKLLLKHDGHEVSEAESGEAALAQFAGGKFDLVITDFLMPGMRGEELVTRIRQLAPKQPIIMASGFVEESQAGPAGQADAFLQKPFSLESLRKAVDQVVHRGEDL